jgi:hypothetical protein
MRQRSRKPSRKLSQRSKPRSLRECTKAVCTDLGNAYREYTRNREAWQEKLPRAAGTLALKVSEKKSQKKGNGLSPSVTFMHYPLNNYDKTTDHLHESCVFQAV